MKSWWMGLALAGGLAGGDAGAEEPVRYTVQGGDTCASIAQQFYGDARLVEPIHEANAMRSPPPHSLVAGTILLIPPRPAGLPRGPDAKVAAVKNKVEVLAPEARPAHVDDPLYRGNRVATQEVSAAAITFRDETQVRLGERSLVVLLGDAKAAASALGATVSATLVTGDLRALLARSDARANIATDSAAVRVVEGQARIAADPAKTTRLSVYDGNSTIAAQKVRREVETGFGSKAELGSAPTVPRPLPPAPLWSAFVPAVRIDTGVGVAPPAAATYALPAGAKATVASWHVQIARDAEFLDLLVDETVPATTTQVEVKDGVPGRYFVHVSAIDDDRFEGPFARTLELGLVQVRRTATPRGSTVSVRAPNLDCWRVGNVPLARVPGELAVGAREPVLLRCATGPGEPGSLVRVD